MLTKDRIKDAVTALNDLTVDYGDRTKEQIDELDSSIETVIMAAEAYGRIGADNYESQQKKLIATRFVEGYSAARMDIETLIVDQGILFQTTDENDFNELDELTIKAKDGKEVLFVPESRGSWEPVERDDNRRMVPMHVCSECQRNNFYPGLYCTYCGSKNVNE